MSDWTIPQKYLDQSEKIERLKAEVSRLTAEIEKADDCTREFVIKNERLREALTAIEESSRGQDELSYKSFVNEVCNQALTDTESSDE